MAKLPIAEFLEDRLKEYDPKFEVRKGTGFEQLFFKPVSFITQPLRDEADIMQNAQSFRRILLTTAPDDFDEESVDALANNLFVFRDEGSTSGGTARVYYDSAVDREWPVGGAVFDGNNGKTYTNPATFSITETQMSSQIEDGLFYYDIPVISESSGDDANLDENGLVDLRADPDVISVTNKVKIQGGKPRETNTGLIERTKKSIAVRDLVTGKGFNAVMFENFVSTLTELQPIGFGDEEMMRDIVFNTHIGGKVDGYFKTTTVQTTTKNFVGLLIDPTRQTKTNRNLQLEGTSWYGVGTPNIDRSNNRLPVVRQTTPSTAAVFVGTVDLSSPLDLSIGRYVKIGIDGNIKNINLGGVTPGATNKNELVAFINNAFGVNVAFHSGNTIKIVSPSKGLSSEVVIGDPIVGVSALTAVFGLPTGDHTYSGLGPISFVEGTDFEVDDNAGKLRRIIGTSVLAATTTGETTSGTDTLYDSTAAVFTNVTINDILTIQSGPDTGDYRVVDKINSNELRLDAELTDTSSSVEYRVNRTGIKDGETVFLEYYFNPLSIDIGKLIKLDDLGRVRGLRPGREATTITDVAFLRIKSIAIIDPLTFEPIGEPLRGFGGYGVGQYGVGPYGIGSGTDYYLTVNSPHERYSAFEDSYIVISSSFQGFSFAVEYDYVPQVEEYHNFVRSESERVLDADILVKHFIPAYVSGTIYYSVDKTDSSIPDNDTLTALTKEFINKQKSGKPLEYSEIGQYIIRTTDPFDRFGTQVDKFTLEARIHNTDGTTTLITGENRMSIPKADPFPKSTNRPVSPRITHWIADNLVLIRK